MLYFSKLKIISIYTIILILTFFSTVNFLDLDNQNFLKKNINLGLDLQGGSYLLLEVDSKPVVKEKLQNKLLLLRKILKDNGIKYKKIKIQNEKISFEILNNKIKDFESLFLLKENNNINFYYENYKSYELDYIFKENSVNIFF